MSNLGIAGFERYHSNGEDRLPKRDELEQYFVDVFGHKPTKDQLKVFFFHLWLNLWMQNSGFSGPIVLALTF